MATRVIKLREAEEPAPETVQEVLSQSKRPEVGRFLLQVDRQTKRSFATAEAAETAGMVIKKGHPIVRAPCMTAFKQQTKSLTCPQDRLRRPKPTGALFPSGARQADSRPWHASHRGAMSERASGLQGPIAPSAGHEVSPVADCLLPFMVRPRAPSERPWRCGRPSFPTARRDSLSSPSDNFP